MNKNHLGRRYVRYHKHEESKQTILLFREEIWICPKVQRGKKGLFSKCKDALVYLYFFSLRTPHPLPSPSPTG